MVAVSVFYSVVLVSASYWVVLALVSQDLGLAVGPIIVTTLVNDVNAMSLISSCLTSSSTFNLFTLKDVLKFALQ